MREYFPVRLELSDRSKHLLSHQLDARNLGEQLIRKRDYRNLVHLMKHAPGMEPHQIGCVMQRLATSRDVETFAILSAAVRKYANNLRGGVKKDTIRQFLKQALTEGGAEETAQVIGTIVSCYGGAYLIRDDIRQAVDQVFKEQDIAKRNAHLFDLVQAVHGKRDTPICPQAAKDVEELLKLRRVDVRYIPASGTSRCLQGVGPVLLMVENSGGLKALYKKKDVALGDVLSMILNTDDLATLVRAEDRKKYTNMAQFLNIAKTGEFVGEVRRFVHDGVLFNLAALDSLRDLREIRREQVHFMLQPAPIGQLTH